MPRRKVALKTDVQRQRAAFRLSRRYAREVVLGTLFQLEFQEGDREQMLGFALSELEAESGRVLAIDDDSAQGQAGASSTVLSESDLRFAQELLTGVCERRVEIDEVLASFARDWSLARIGRLERSILRMALYELLWRDDIPPAATLDEAVELTKAYCAPEASAFINGILGNIHQHLVVQVFPA